MVGVIKNRTDYKMSKSQHQDLQEVPEGCDHSWHDILHDSKFQTYTWWNFNNPNPKRPGFFVEPLRRSDGDFDWNAMCRGSLIGKLFPDASWRDGACTTQLNRFPGHDSRAADVGRIVFANAEDPDENVRQCKAVCFASGDSPCDQLTAPDAKCSVESDAACDHFVVQDAACYLKSGFSEGELVRVGNTDLFTGLPRDPTGIVSERIRCRSRPSEVHEANDREWNQFLDEHDFVPLEFVDIIDN
jgi:hypothetical protein